MTHSVRALEISEAKRNGFGGVPYLLGGYAGDGSRLAHGRYRSSPAVEDGSADTQTPGLVLLVVHRVASVARPLQVMQEFVSAGDGSGRSRFEVVVLQNPL